jgi:hypothetical protein
MPSLEGGSRDGVGRAFLEDEEGGQLHCIMGLCDKYKDS